MRIELKVKNFGKDMKKAKKNFDRFFKKAHRKARCKKCKRVHILSI